MCAHDRRNHKNNWENGKYDDGENIAYEKNIPTISMHHMSTELYFV